jgi:hypothetical protein
MSLPPTDCARSCLTSAVREAHCSTYRHAAVYSFRRMQESMFQAEICVYSLLGIPREEAEEIEM